ncbi:MAG: hypothetical protein KKC68_02290 [Candidatus Thermoplasmatota archaeon]|nr:hypothetical protein [Candidatus Thermoplasmatota archaeon]MBU1940580.1 hypothetical protein [Candidatus Thermoplasmatota archaeon]
MVHGIPTDNKTYKHKNRTDIKWLCKDLNIWRQYIENYIQQQNHTEVTTTIEETHATQPILSFVNIFAILFLGFTGTIALLTGIYILLQGTYIIGVFLTIIGAIFLISFILYQYYR